MGMRKHFLDNIRWVTVVIVVVYHVLYMYNAEGILGGLGKVTDLAMQPWDVVQYLVYPWMMPVLFLVAGISARLSLDRRSEREFVRNRTRRLLVPSTIGVVVFHVVQGYVSLSL
jgi:fucose 4-O-acetylase-like acetyltransferase